MGERLAEPGLIVPELAFGDGLVLPDPVDVVAVAGGEAFQGVQDRPRSLVFLGKNGVPRGGPFEVHVGRELRVKHHSKTQAAVGAERYAGSLADVPR